jgi:NADPH-dependent 2,4-dienoyl-CoA reductase/sulfur reductase-like enzyme
VTRVVIVGGGPAGIRAASVLTEAGLRPVLIDESRQVGGQGYRAPSAGLRLDMAPLMGSQAGKYRRLHALFAGLRSRVDYRPETLAWAAHEGVLYLACGERAASVPYDALLLATGARDRVMPLPGWTLPGVFTLGGAQAILKDQGCFIGRRIAFLGSSPLLGLGALQYRKLGGDITVVADTTSFGAKLAAWRDLFACPLTFGRGLAYGARLKAAGLLVLEGVVPLAIEGDDHVRAVRLRDSAGVERTIACDAVALGYGLEPEAQLAELAGASFTFDPDLRQWFPQIDGDGRAGAGLYLAGDGAATGGADAAEASGTLAALAILSDLGQGRGMERRRTRLRRVVQRRRRFQRGLARAFAWPAAQVEHLPDDTVLCRCEAVTVGEVRRTVSAALGPQDVNRVKALTRCGMGRCQGRICGAALQEIVAATAGIDLARAGRLRGQAPVKPVPMAIGVEACL